MNKIIKNGAFYQVLNIHNDIISKRYKTLRGATQALKNINQQ